MRAKKTIILQINLVILSVFGLASNNPSKGASSEPAREITCTGKVIDSAGEPLENAKVKLYKLTVIPEAFTYDMAIAQESTTKNDGSFTLKTEASQGEMTGQTIILVEKDGFSLGWANWVLRQDLDVRIKLDKPQVMAGKVVDEAGKPIPDAEVSIAFMIVTNNGQPRYLIGAGSLDPLNTRTSMEGRFSFGRIPAQATAEFFVKKTGKATVSTFNPENYRGQALQYSSGQTDIEIALPPEARIEGIVMEKTTGKPAAGISIMATKGRNQPNFGLKPTVSGDDGTFSIDALDSGTYSLRIVTPPGKEAEWIAEPVEVVTEPGKTKNGVKVELSKGGLLEVVITEAKSQNPVQGARVSIQQQSRNEYFGAVSDEKGIARVRLLPGEYQMSGIYKDSYTRLSQQETITVEDGQTTRLERQLAGLPKITGVVRDEQGNPVKGVKLQVCPMGTGQDVVSDTEGKFEVSWDTGRWHSSETPAMVLVARYEQDNLAAVVDVDEDTQTKDITLRPALIVTGKVVDPNDKSIINAQITPMLRGPRWGSSISRSQATTDVDGRFEIKALPNESSYTIYTRAEGYGENRSEEINSADAIDNKLDIGSITLAVANLSVSGIVVDNEDKPVAGARVYSYGDNQPNRNTQTGQEGKFTLDGVCAGKLRISANKSGISMLHGFVETEGGATDVKIIIGESSSSARYVPKTPPSLVGKPLPDLKDLKIDLPQADLNGRMLLVCFFDMQQRPSRHCLLQIAAKTQELEAKNIVVVGVQASSMDEKRLQNWCKKYKVSFPVGMVRGDEEKTRFTWGVKSLPWLILTDSKHIITAEGFGLAELDKRTKPKTDK